MWQLLPRLSHCLRPPVKQVDPFYSGAAAAATATVGPDDDDDDGWQMANGSKWMAGKWQPRRFIELSSPTDRPADRRALARLAGQLKSGRAGKVATINTLHSWLRWLAGQLGTKRVHCALAFAQKLETLRSFVRLRSRWLARSLADQASQPAAAEAKGLNTSEFPRETCRCYCLNTSAKTTISERRFAVSAKAALHCSTCIHLCRPI